MDLSEFGFVKPLEPRVGTVFLAVLSLWQHLQAGRERERATQGGA